jgi:hypothetical protein
MDALKKSQLIKTIYAFKNQKLRPKPETTRENKNNVNKKQTNKQTNKQACVGPVRQLSE